MQSTITIASITPAVKTAWWVGREGGREGGRERGTDVPVLHHARADDDHQRVQRAERQRQQRPGRLGKVNKGLSMEVLLKGEVESLQDGKVLEKLGVEGLGRLWGGREGGREGGKGKCPEHTHTSLPLSHLTYPTPPSLPPSLSFFLWRTSEK